MNISLSDLYNSAAKSPEDKSEAGETSEDKKETSEEKPDEEKEPAEEKTEEGKTQRSLLVPLNSFKYLMFSTFLCID